jgi:hypothetical protein
LVRAKLVLVSVLFVALTGVGASAVALQIGPVPEQLVEGHIVFTVIETPPGEFQKNRTAAAVAVLVRERVAPHFTWKNPGVLWFNDQYLVDPIDNTVYDDRIRYPCTGAILAVGEGDPDPRARPLSAYNESTYNESYWITDPNSRLWKIHKWNFSGDYVWSVGIYGSRHDSDKKDDQYCTRDPVKDRARHATNTTYGYPCGGNGGPKCTNGVWYNAVLYFYLEDLDVVGQTKNHTKGSADYANDVSGCHDNGSPYFPEQWPCPNGDDDREGNSHPYNPAPYAFPAHGRTTHGYSADCTGDGIYDRYCHTTRKIDLYYGVAPDPETFPWPFEPRYEWRDEKANQAYMCQQDASPITDFCT